MLIYVGFTLTLRVGICIFYGNITWLTTTNMGRKATDKFTFNDLVRNQTRAVAR